MAFRKSGLSAIGGFDAQFRRAGDDVDVCWRIQNMGWTIGFSPAALVWHHRRASIGAYLKQQKSYGQAEALLQRKWPEKFNIAGQMEWHGRLYGAGLLHGLGLSHRIYHGARGSAPFQSLRSPVPSSLSYLPAMPEWLVVTLFLGGLSALGWLWPRLLWCVPLFALAVGVSVYQAAVSAGEATRFGSLGSSRAGLAGLRCLTFLFYLLQPAARLWGRVSYGLLPGKPRVPRVLAWPVRKKLSYWSEEWQVPEQRLKRLESAICERGVMLVRGGNYDRWDFEVRTGLLGAARLLLTVEEHGDGTSDVPLPPISPLHEGSDDDNPVAGTVGGQCLAGWSLVCCGDPRNLVRFPGRICTPGMRVSDGFSGKDPLGGPRGQPGAGLPSFCRVPDVIRRWYYTQRHNSLRMLEQRSDRVLEYWGNTPTLHHSNPPRSRKEFCRPV